MLGVPHFSPNLREVGYPGHDEKGLWRLRRHPQVIRLLLHAPRIVFFSGIGIGLRESVEYFDTR